LQLAFAFSPLPHYFHLGASLTYKSEPLLLILLQLGGRLFCGLLLKPFIVATDYTQTRFNPASAFNTPLWVPQFCAYLAFFRPFPFEQFLPTLMSLRREDFRRSLRLVGSQDPFPWKRFHCGRRGLKNDTSFRVSPVLLV